MSLWDDALDAAGSRLHDCNDPNPYGWCRAHDRAYSLGETEDNDE